MPILKKPHNIPAVPVASQVVDDDGKLTQEFVHFLRAVADLVRDIDDIEVLARKNDWRPPAQSEILADPAADKQILYNQGGTVTSDPNFTWDSSNQVATVTGKTGSAAYPALVVTDPNTPHTAYLQSDAGFLTNSTATNAIQAPNGGVTAKDIAATDSVWNGLQNSTGGIAANALYTKANGSAPANPGASYGGFDYQGGSVYWYWNGTTWATVNLATAGSTTPPPGSDQQVAYNAAGAWGASAGLTWNYTASRLSIVGGNGSPLFINGNSANSSMIRFLGSTSGNLWAIGTDYAGTNSQDFSFYSYGKGPVVTLVYATGNMGLGVTGPTHQLELSTDSAAKPATNAWTIFSDIRLKTDVREYQEGLSTIRQIKPIRYALNGKAGTPENLKGVGLDAAAHKDLLPDCISTIEGEIDGEKTDIHQFNSHALTFMLINAVRELAERLEKLESQHEPIRHWFSNLPFGRHHE
jgi:hypothetical protein